MSRYIGGEVYERRNKWIEVLFSRKENRAFPKNDCCFPTPFSSPFLPPSPPKSLTSRPGRGDHVHQSMTRGSFGLFEIVPFNLEQRCFFVFFFDSEKRSEKNRIDKFPWLLRNISAVALRKERTFFLSGLSPWSKQPHFARPFLHVSQEESLIHGRRSRHRSRAEASYCL